MPVIKNCRGFLQTDGFNYLTNSFVIACHHAAMAAFG
uniref:Uncharacterized protein n=1 Tax=Rhizophora mucronata TaxID=61149 RepID=A0A2P2QR14_RHIMU